MKYAKVKESMKKKKKDADVKVSTRKKKMSAGEESGHEKYALRVRNDSLLNDRARANDRGLELTQVAEGSR